MKRNIFWMIWGVASLVCVLVAGFKSFALEVEQKKQNNKPVYVNTETENHTDR